MKRFYKWLTPMRLLIILACFYILCMLAGGIDPSRYL